MNVDERYLYKKKDIAFLFGVTVQALDGWDVKPHRREGNKSLYYLPDVIAWRLKRDTKETLDLTKERARLAAAQAEKTEMENEKTRGSHVDKEDVIKATADFINSLKSSLEAEGSRHSQNAVNQKPAEVFNSYRSAIERAFANVTNRYNGNGNHRRSRKRVPKVSA